ncbi:MAG: antitoxin [Actinomycetota bacterium]
MRTLYLRNVPDEVMGRLERLAAAAGLSVGALAVRELAQSSLRADNPLLLGALPDHDVAPSDIVAALDAERSAR